MGDRFYTLILSSFKAGNKLGGVIEFESNAGLTVKVIQPEGSGMQLS